MATALLVYSSYNKEIDGKTVPEWTGIDSRAENIYQQYIKLSTDNHIVFHKPITIGFKKINTGNIIGVCYPNDTFREIDIDINFWNNSKLSEKTALLFHELSHCLCGRDHDYGNGQEYPEVNEFNLKSLFLKDSTERSGYLNDECPMSIMAPILLSKSCFLKHYDFYTKEMYHRCDAW